ncbi:MAG: TorF family putative porin [Pseudomonadota bacterium]
MKFTTAKLLAVAALAAAPMLASAQLSANVSVTTNYKFRGQDQGNNKPALQGGFDYAHSSGFYVGNWNSSIGFTASGLESDLYAGYKFEAAGLGFDVGILTYIYPTLSAADTTELYGAATWGPITAKYSHTISDDYFGFGAGSNRGTGYWNLAFAQEVMKGLTLKASYGYTNFDNPANTNYADYSLGLAYDLGNGFSVSGAAVGANKRATYGVVNKTRLIFTLTKAM